MKYFLESLISAFYERAGRVKLKDGSYGSVTIGGTVSPAGGNFEEPVTQATLKVVGAFHGLSRERSDARKYPAIHPLESWSKYPGIIDEKKVETARSIMFRGNEVNQMMKVVGEEGTSVEDYITYQKGELLDAVYLQQNSFDPVDGAVGEDRQKYIFELLYKILTAKYNIQQKNQARLFFNEVRQKFLDWNAVKMEDPKFKQIEKELANLYQGKKVRQA